MTLLRVDCDIEASWDGLRKFWSIELTKGGVLMRDRACKAEAENAKLLELVRDMWLTGSLCDAIPDIRLQANGGDWRTMQERVDEALGIEVDE